jgi:hypothetical protein
MSYQGGNAHMRGGHVRREVEADVVSPHQPDGDVVDQVDLQGLQDPPP